MIDRSRLHAHFLLALAASAVACASSDPGPKTPDPATRENPLLRRAGGHDVSVLEPQLAEAMKKEGATFKGADLHKAGISTVEIVNVVDGGHSDGIVCDTDPCAPETLAIPEKEIYARGLVVREAGKVRPLFEDGFAQVFGDVDGPEKAALRAAISGSYMALARCSDLEAFGASCAEGSKPDEVPVRADAGGGWDVVMFGETNVCSDHQFGRGDALAVLHVKPTGELSGIESQLGDGSAKVVLMSRSVHCETPMLGRMFEGYVDRPEGCDLRGYLLRAERQEAAAVHAFARLVGELVHFGAPEALVQAARRGVDDERRHARLFAAALARLDATEGCATALDEAAPPAAWTPRSLFEVLLENALEGCANETYAALVATHQAEGAAPADLRPLFAAIAADEREHAALSFDLHRWGREKLSAPEREALDAALLGALARMRGARPSRVGVLLGEPDPSLAAAAFDRVVAALAAPGA